MCKVSDINQWGGCLPHRTSAQSSRHRGAWVAGFQSLPHRASHEVCFHTRQCSRLASITKQYIQYARERPTQISVSSSGKAFYKCDGTLKGSGRQIFQALVPAWVRWSLNYAIVAATDDLAAPVNLEWERCIHLGTPSCFCPGFPFTGTSITRFLCPWTRQCF